MRVLGFGVLACFALLLGSASAQEFRATLNGVVSDAQDARIPASAIEVTNAATGAKFATVSSASGQYAVPLLRPGMYTVVDGSPGSKRYVRENIHLTTNDRVTLDIKLPVGAIAESVTVTGDAPLLSTSTASVGQAITAAISTGHSTQHVSIPFLPSSSRPTFVSSRRRFSNMRAERINNLDTAVIKNIAIVEGFRVQFRAEAFNMLNRTQFSPPSLAPTSTAFGKVTAQANWPRVVQATLRLVW